MSAQATLRRPASWRIGGIAVFCLAAFLLLSMGGAIIAAPITVPLMFVATRRYPTRAFRIAGSVLTAATIAELVWAVTYFAAGEAKPWIWLLPVVAAVVSPIPFWSRTDPRRSSSTKAIQSPLPPL